MELSGCRKDVLISIGLRELIIVKCQSTVKEFMIIYFDIPIS